MKTADDVTITTDMTVYCRVGGKPYPNPNTWRVSELRVVSIGRTKIRCERVNGKLGCYRKPNQLFAYKTAAKAASFPVRAA